MRLLFTTCNLGKFQTLSSGGVLTGWLNFIWISIGRYNFLSSVFPLQINYATILFWNTVKSQFLINPQGFRDWAERKLHSDKFWLSFLSIPLSSLKISVLSWKYFDTFFGLSSFFSLTTYFCSWPLPKCSNPLQVFHSQYYSSRVAVKFYYPSSRSIWCWPPSTLQ